MDSNIKWEYKLVVIKTFKNTRTGFDDNLNDRFNELGVAGWELVKIESVQKRGFLFFGFGGTSYTDSMLAIFKRIIK